MGEEGMGPRLVGRDESKLNFVATVRNGSSPKQTDCHSLFHYRLF